MRTIKHSFCILITILITNIIIYFLNDQLISTEIEKCPFCYGQNFCKQFHSEVTYTNLTILEKLINWINPKNVYTAYLKNKKIVLKKLAHNWELENLDKSICQNQNQNDNCKFDQINVNLTINDIIELFNKKNKSEVSNLIICESEDLNEFCKILLSTNEIETIWTTLLINAEPLLLQILNNKDGWPVPEYYGACGRVIAEEYCGPTLNAFSHENWSIRAQIALELLLSADQFTNKHQLFRFYLTDISPDNIAVTSDFQIRFIDLENVIVTRKRSSLGKWKDYSWSRSFFEPFPLFLQAPFFVYRDPQLNNPDEVVFFLVNKQMHETKQFDCDNCYAFSMEEICEHEISDHNYYSICKFLLSKHSPWPMMENGLLHSPPNYITEQYANLYDYVEICANSSPHMNRIDAAMKLIEIFKIINDNEKL